MYKLRNSLVAIDATQHLVPVTGIAASAHPHRYIGHPAPTQIYGNSFFPRTIIQWNALPESVALAPSIDAFRRRVCQIHH